MTAARVGWWDTHEEAWRRARRLFAVNAGIVALYLTGIVTIVVLVLAAIVTGDGDVVSGWVDDLGVAGSIGVVVGAVVVAALVIAALGWHGLPYRTRRLSGARVPAPHEVDHLRSVASTFALAFGMPAPTIWVIADDAPNALAFGRRDAGHVAVTTGALRLPRSSLDPLVMFHISALRSRAWAFATSAADLILLGEWLTNLMWISCAFAILSTAIGVPIAVAAVYVVGVGAVVLLTRPVVAFADRDLVALLHEIDLLVDLETIRHTNDPKAYAALLLTMLEDDARVHGPWQVAHLWYERDVVDRFGWSAPEFVERCERNTRRDLLARAAVAVTLANGEARLQARLERARRPGVHPTR